MPEDYDYKQEVARSAYADMLHDAERNDKYYEGVRRAVAALRRRGEAVRVLDIGTGTGLLSMMAVACGADSVTACEAFYPMAECARKGLAANGCGDKVHLIPKRSTEIEVGPGRDMEKKANLLVAEVFDTELIGEGAIDTYRHARDFLLTEDAILVPSEGTVFAQVVSSAMLQRWNKVSDIREGGGGGEVLVSTPPSVTQCPGAAAVHDLQLSQVKRPWFSALSPPLPVFKFDWSGRKKDLPCDETTRVKFTSLAGGQCDAVLMWWDVIMDPEGEVVLSCAPFWAHPDCRGKDEASSEDIPWRDHWMQAVYYLPAPCRVTEGATLTLVSSHDEYSLWFNVQQTEGEKVCEDRPVCECGIHILNSRTRLGQLNDPSRQEVYLRVLRRLVTPDTVLLVLGDGCVVALAAARMGARHVYVAEGSEAGRRVMQAFITTNGIQDKVTILTDSIADTTLTQLVAPVTAVFSEPHFTTSLLPWHALYCWYARSSCTHLLDPSPTLAPRSATLWALPVWYRDLWKIRAPLHTCNGFKMGVFDKLIEMACEEADEKVEPHPLWEYPAIARANPVPLLTLDLCSLTIPTTPVTSEGSVTLPPPGVVNGMALWVDWRLTDEEEDVVTTGPTKDVVIGEYVQWDMYSRQGVYLFPAPHSLHQDSTHTLHFSTTFLPHDGTMNFDFQISSSSSPSSSSSSVCKAHSGLNGKD